MNHDNWKSLAVDRTQPVQSIYTSDFFAHSGNHSGYDVYNSLDNPRDIVRPTTLEILDSSIAHVSAISEALISSLKDIENYASARLDIMPTWALVSNSKKAVNIMVSYALS